METGPTGVDLEQISDDFVCCICLDVIYKPVVLFCGHMSCFWCVHKSMSGVQVSHCPMCRNPYNHFPNICELLHNLIVNAYPEACTIRHFQILGEERKKGRFSPVLCCSHQEDDGNLLNKTSYSTSGGINTVEIEGGSLSETNHNEAYQSISVNDVLCASCNHLLFQPVVLNCGHVFCASCITPAADMSIQAVCQVCQMPDPRGYPKVCLAFDNFLVGHFPKEYEMRKEAEIVSVQLKKNKSEKEYFSYTRSVHEGVGCDFCGMYPIIGDRYKCVDCIEDMGFDLCQYCRYKGHLKLHGRFNQQHTPEHKFEHLRMPNHPNGELPMVVRLRYRYLSISSPTADQDDDETTSGNTQ